MQYIALIFIKEAVYYTINTGHAGTPANLRPNTGYF